MNDARAPREYGAGGWVGVGTPQANPTVEMEMRRFLPADVEALTTRLRSRAETADARLVDYIENLPHFLAAFDTLALDAFGFACTGSSYLVGADREAAIAAAAAARFGYPVVTATAAVAAAFQALGARRVALLAPYPAHLIAAGVAYWEAAGFQITATRRIDIGSADTRRIYGLSSADALAGLADLDVGGADAVLMSGTGMPTWPILGQAAQRSGRPVVSSNSCLAWALLQSLGVECAPTEVGDQAAASPFAS